MLVFYGFSLRKKYKLHYCKFLVVCPHIKDIFLIRSKQYISIIDYRNKTEIWHGNMRLSPSGDETRVML